jgi:uncharacterized protein
VADRAPEPAFGVETIHLDLPALAGALGQRLRDAGVPVTPERAADFARAIALVRPVSRRRLYWAARSMFVSDESHAAAFDAVFRTVFGQPVALIDEVPEGVPTVPGAPAPPSERPPRRRQGSSEDRPRAEPRAGVLSSSAPSSQEEEEGEVEVPRAIASDEERLAGKSFDALDRHELARLYRMMSRLELATPLRRARRFEHAHHGRRVDLRRTLRGSLRTGGDAIHLARRRRRIVRRRLVMLCDISGSMEPYARAYLQFLTCAAGSGPHAEAFVFATRLTRLTRALSSRHPEVAI